MYRDVGTKITPRAMSPNVEEEHAAVRVSSCCAGVVRLPTLQYCSSAVWTHFLLRQAGLLGITDVVSKYSR